jgi:hypothetical protein
MLTLPRSSSSLLVRTDFTDDDAWDRMISEALREYEVGFRAYIEPVEDTALDGAPWDKVRAAVPANDHGAAVLFIADSWALKSPDHPSMVVDLRPTEEPPFRCIPSKLWSVDNNLNLANMDWREFVGAADDDGIFRGFGE